MSSDNGTCKSLNLRTAYRSIFPALGLEIDIAESKFVFFYNSVNPSIACCLKGFPRVVHRPAVSHGKHKVNDKLFKELWTVGLDGLQQFRRERSMDS